MSWNFLKAFPPLGSRHVVRAAVLMVVIFVLLLSYLYFDVPVPTSIGTSILPQIPNGSDSASTTDGPHVEFVVASMKDDDTSWFAEYIPQWKANIYVVDDPSATLTVPQNKGREAMVYLTHIINNYNNLPDAMVFLHSSRYQWHNDDPLFDGMPLMQSLQADYILSEGYINLRCVWSLGCPAEIRPQQQESNRPPADQAAQTEVVYGEAFKELFPGKPVPEAVGVACCAQFAATRDKVRERPLEDYERYRDWVLNTTLEDSISGRVMEYSWHLIFGRPAVHCPNVQACYCKTYGLCNLTCPEEYRCGARWHFPPSASLPKGWPEYGWKGEFRTPEQLQEMRLEAMVQSSSTVAQPVAAVETANATG